MGTRRPECEKPGPYDLPAPTGLSAYLQIYGAVDRAKGLGHGKLHTPQGSCAVGCYFDIDQRRTLPSLLIDEVAGVNDAVPHYSPQGRRDWVLRWLRWKLGTYGYHVGPGRPTKHGPKAA